MNKAPLLSISLLTSDRKDTIRKCLDSLQPLREQISSELIIVDTGCDEEMLGIIGEYADEIVHFTWCDDFAKARNAGLERARGNWFLYIDDDEWFEDVEPIIAFFQSDEYKNYTFANYMVRNYSDFSGTQYMDTWVTRIFALGKNVRFTGSVHEYPILKKGNVKTIQSFVHHYGYAFSTKEEENRHFQRNVSLLENMVQKEPQNTRWWKQLAQEYAFAKEHHKFYEVCKKAVDLFQNQSSQSINLDRGCFYNGQIMAKTNLCCYEDGIRDYKFAIADQRNNTMCQLRLFARGAKLYFCIEDYDNCEQCCHEYLDLYETIKDDQDAQAIQGDIFTQDACEPDVRDFIYCFLISCGLRKKNLEALHTYFDCLGWKNERIYLYEKDIVEEMIHAMSEYEYEEYFVHIAQYIMDRDGLYANAMHALHVIEENAKKFAEGELEYSDSEKKFERIIRIFSKIQSEDYYIDYLKIRNAQLDEHSAELPQYYARLFDKVLDIFQLDDSVWEIAEQYQVDLEPLFFQIPFASWKAGVVSFCENSPLATIQKRVKMVERMQRTENIRYQFFYIKSAEARLMYGEAKDQYQELRKLLEGFVDQTLEFYHEYYTKRAFEGEMDMLPDACKAAVRLRIALDSEKQDGYKGVLANYKNCLGVCPSLDQAIASYCHLYADEIKRKHDNPQTAFKLQLMAEQVLKQVQILLEARKTAEALEVVQQLRTMLPEDERIQEMEEQIRLQLS